MCEWLNSNKLSLNVSKSKVVIFHPYQHKLCREVNLKILDNDSEQLTSLERKTYVKYIGVLTDGNLSWKHHINYISTKIIKGIGIIARLRHRSLLLVPCTALLSNYRSLIEPHISYGFVSWGQATNTHLRKIVILQKRVLRLMYFFRLYISQCSSFCLFGNSTDKNALLQIGCISVTWHRKIIALLLTFLNFLLIRAGSFLPYPFLSSWKLLYKTGANKSSVAFLFQSWCENMEWHPPWTS